MTTTYRKVGEPVEVRALIMQENTEQSTLVTTLEDGSIVYMGGETSLQYPDISLWTSVRSVCRETLCLMWPVTGNVLSD